MLSCEAQRTLIKSPLELWEELGDPAGLSRHFGKLGEIRITRIEPETMVEWESEELRGTIALDPSGWGTKVTLTAAGRDLSQSGVAGASHEGAEGMEPEGAEAEALGAMEPEQAGPGIGSAEVTAEPAAPGESSGSDAETRPEPPAGEHARTTEPGVAITPEAPTEPAIAMTSEAPTEPAVAMTSDAPSGPGTQAISEATVEPPITRAPAERRRGFLARLFGRGARSERSEPLAVEPETAAAIEPEAAVALEPEANREASVTAEQGSEAGTPAEPGPETILAGQAIPEPEAEPVLKSGITVIPESEAAAIEAVEPEPEPRLGIWLDEIEQAEAAEIHAARGASEPAGETRRSPRLSQEEVRRSPRLSQEEVQEVLTETLDRLGAAHHRPFSRA